MGLVLVVVAIVLGIVLLAKGGGIGFDDDAKKVAIGKDEDPSVEETTSTTAPESVTSVPAGELRIAVLNAAGKAGFAALGKNFLSVAGYPTATAGNAAGQELTSSVYFAPGYKADAAAVAKVLSIGEVSEIPSTPLGKTAEDVPEGTAVVVVLGPDAEPVISATDVQQPEPTPADDGAGEGGTGEGGGITDGGN